MSKADSSKTYTFVFATPEDHMPRPSDIRNIKNAQIPGSIYNYWTLFYLVRNAYAYMHPRHNIVFTYTASTQAKEIRDYLKNKGIEPSPSEGYIGFYGEDIIYFYGY